MLRQYPSSTDEALGRLRDTKFSEWLKDYVSVRSYICVHVLLFMICFVSLNNYYS